MYEPYLAHYGVKGMKWGVRKNRFSLGRKSGGAPKTKPKTKAEKAAQTRAKNERKRKRGVRASKAVGYTYLGAGVFGMAYMRSKTVRVVTAAATNAAKRGAIYATAALVNRAAYATNKRNQGQASPVDVGEAIIRKVT